ncbi:MAG: nucleoside-diphosphate sugar epimerase/dehydratase [Dysgonamonadaceae bacterium]|nr:nucleoside-diphosphate sugar epimerase/dehydratase [Dysgonamonadaceae bacterium]MDD4728893.1 nucleoside-diphosphate sugar epimerase/dehydratase [Dysgonamonadaceae bacterium]
MKFLKNFLAKRVLSRSAVLLLDILILISSVFITYLLWSNVETISISIHQLIVFVSLLILFNVVAFFFFKTFSGILRFSSFSDLLKIILALTTGYTLTFLFIKVLNFSHGVLPFNIQVFVLVYILNAVLMVFSRVIVKETYELLINQHGNTLKVFVYGTKQTGIRIAKSLKGNNEFNFRVKGFISDETHMIGKNVLGVKVYGVNEDLFRTLEQKEIKRIIVSPHKLQEIKDSHLLDKFLENSISLMTTLPLSEWESDKITKNQLKEIQIEDLLPRKQININMRGIASNLEGKRVMITGAAGSIGSEIVRQVAAFNPYLLILIDQAETPLHSLRLEIRDKWKEVRALTFVADIANFTRLENIFNESKPDYIFHAAAYKHVPMMEENVSEAIQTNIQGTKNLADLAVKYHSKKFVMISTDKAVNPTNVMGCSKRIAEIYVHSLSKYINDKNISSVQFITTRFGNVLGSNGSVIPLFREQIRKGGPVTVTHPDIIRYFMTISEACQLVLEAGSIGKGGEIFIFDMGDPVKILDLAKRMIRLSGAQSNIKIEFSGLRHGEKLYEELLSSSEHTKPTYNDKIMVANVREYEYKDVTKLISELVENSFCYDDMESVALMKALVPEFKSVNSPYESIDKKNNILQM